MELDLTMFSFTCRQDYTRRHAKQLDKTVEIDIIKAELEEKQFKCKLCVIDTPGFGDYVNNRDCWTPIVRRRGAHNEMVAED